MSGTSDQSDPPGFYFKNGPCVGPVVETPSTPEGISFTGPNIITWKQSRRDKSGTSSAPPDRYVVVWDEGTIDESRFEALRGITSGANQRAIHVTPTNLAIQTAEIPVSGEFYVRVRAENTNGNSELSEQIKAQIVGTGSIAFTPRLIPKSGVERVKMNATGEVFGADLKILINGSEIAFERDKLVDYIVYFTPPVPGMTTSFNVVLENYPTTGENLSLGTQKLVVNATSPEDAFRSVISGARVRLEENFSRIKKKKDDGGYTGNSDFTASEFPPNELLHAAYSELKITQFYVDDFIAAYGPLLGSTTKQNELDLETAGNENNLYLTARIRDLVGEIQVDPALSKTAAAPGVWGEADFFTRNIEEMKGSGKDYIDGQVPDVPIFEIKWVLIKASAYEMTFQTYNTAGKTLLNATLDQPTARVILNGPMFGPKDMNRRPIPFKISGQMWINCVEPPVSSQVGEPGYNRGRTLWSMSRLVDLSYKYDYGNPTPIPPNQDCNTANTVKTGTGGLYLFNRAPVAGPVHYTLDPNLLKLQNYFYGKTLIKKIGQDLLGGLAHSFAGFAGIAHYTDKTDNEKYLLIFAKEQWLVKIPARIYYTHTLWDAQLDLFKMNAEWTVGVDGGPVTALAFNDGQSLRNAVRSWNHWGTVPDDINTTPSYFVFK